MRLAKAESLSSDAILSFLPFIPKDAYYADH